MLNVSIIGACGRMGRTLLRCVNEADDLQLTGAAAEPGDPELGHDAGRLVDLSSLGVQLTDNPVAALQSANVAIDFTLPIALPATLKACVNQGVPLVVGTTGLTELHLVALKEAGQTIPLVYARNMSVGVNVFMELVRRGAEALDADYDVEIIEAHHRHKVDAPSGTALALGELVAQARGGDLESLGVFAREGQTGARKPGSIGFSAIRAGNIVGEHTVMFGSADERLELTHRAAERTVFAKGALRAARWVAGRAPGLYDMGDVLGFKNN
jgi:4-hydroxy-tetrahydrodipicolinate reductase